MVLDLKYISNPKYGENEGIIGAIQKPGELSFDREQVLITRINIYS